MSDNKSVLQQKGFVEVRPGVFEKPRSAEEGGGRIVASHPKAALREAAVKRKKGMNKTEGAYADRLNAMKMAGEILEFRYEPIKLMLAGDTLYIPDFMVVNKQLQLELHEVKTMWNIGKASERVGITDDAWVKLKVAAEQFPWFVFIRAVHRKSEWIITEI